MYKSLNELELDAIFIDCVHFSLSKRTASDSKYYICTCICFGTVTCYFYTLKDTSCWFSMGKSPEDTLIYDIFLRALNYIGHIMSYPSLPLQYVQFTKTCAEVCLCRACGLIWPVTRDAQTYDCIRVFYVDKWGLITDIQWCFCTREPIPWWSGAHFLFFKESGPDSPLLQSKVQLRAAGAASLPHINFPSPPLLLRPRFQMCHFTARFSLGEWILGPIRSLSCCEVRGQWRSVWDEEEMNYWCFCYLHWVFPTGDRAWTGPLPPLTPALWSARMKGFLSPCAQHSSNSADGQG